MVAQRPRQRRLLDDLEAFFFKYGYKSATMDRLARDLKCSKRTLYELAASRSDLFAMIVDRWATRIRELGQEARAKELHPRDRLVAYLKPGVTQTVTITGAFLQDVRDLPQARAILKAHQLERMTHLKEVIEEGQRTGAFQRVHSHLVAGICLAGIDKINEPAFLEGAGLTFSEAFDELYRLILQGLGSGDGDASASNWDGTASQITQ